MLRDVKHSTYYMKKLKRLDRQRAKSGGTFIHEKSRQFQRGLSNFNKLWAKMRFRINPEID
jgi:hypothetical protein